MIYIMLSPCSEGIQWRLELVHDDENLRLRHVNPRSHRSISGLSLPYIWLVAAKCLIILLLYIDIYIYICSRHIYWNDDHRIIHVFARAV